MGRLCTIRNIVIRIYPNDHLPPHFHVIAPDYEALVEIETLVERVGTISSKDRAEVMAWVQGNKQFIVAEWNRTNPRFKLEK